jgi:hypothetical protein
MTGQLLDSFILGLSAGAVLFGSVFGALGWVIGYNLALRKVVSWMRPPADEAPGDVPTIARGDR